MAAVLVLGGGIGGVVAAKHLAWKLGNRHRIRVVDRAENHIFYPSLLWVLEGKRQPRQLLRPLRRLAANGIEVLQAEVKAIDPVARVVRADGKELAYDFLVIALGAELAPQTIPGFEAALDLYSVEGVVRLRQTALEMERGRVVLVIARTPFRCPAAPYEAAFILDRLFRQRGVRSRVELEIITPEPQPMPIAGPVIGARLRGMLERQGIGLRPNSPVASISPDTREVVLPKGERVPYDLLIGVAPHRAPSPVAPLTDATGWIPVKGDTLETSQPQVYAIGDVTALKLPDGRLLPKAGVFAHAQAAVVARNIAAQVKGRNARSRFSGNGYCFIELGGGRAGFASGNFFTQPSPLLKMRPPGFYWHWGKVLFEKFWFWRFL